LLRVCETTLKYVINPVHEVSYLETSFNSAMHLGVYKGSIRLAPFVSMAGITVHLVVTVGSSTVGEEDHHLVDRFWVLAEVVLKQKEVKFCQRLV
jgi:hypothetical protein